MRSQTCWRGAAALAAAAVVAGFGVTEPAPAAKSAGVIVDGESAVRWQLTELVNSSMGLIESELVDLDTDLVPGVAFTATIPIDGIPSVLALEPHSVRGAGYTVYETDTAGALVPVEPGPVNTFRGVIEGDPGSAVAASIINGGLHALIRLGNGLEFWLEPVAPHVAGLDPRLHVVYADGAVVADGGTCGLNEALLVNEEGEALVPVDEEAADSPADGPADGMEIALAQLACDADYPYYQDWGSSTEDRINAVINTVNLQYEGQVGITHFIVAIIIRTSSAADPYSSSSAGTLLDQFRSWWLANEGSLTRDVTHLFTGRSLQGSTIGIAWTIGGICTSGAYSLAESDFNGNFSCATDLSAHELGHLWGAFHCSCPSYTMNPSITCANNFSSGSQTSIIAHRDSRTCLDTGPQSQYCLALSNNDNFEYISNVTFGAIDNDSGASTYTDFTGFSTVLTAGGSVPISVTIGNSFSNDIGGLWIDWNADSDFTDPGEEIPTSWSGHGPYTATVDVPTTVVPGPTRMRVRIQDGSADPSVNPCGVTAYGEVEDYRVQINDAPEPTNNDCANATPIGNETLAFTTLGATTDGPVEPQLCDINGDEDIGSDIWFVYTTDCPGNVTVSLCGSDYDTRLGVYNQCPTQSLQIIACNDDFCGQQSQLSFLAFPGTYRFRVGGFMGAKGEGMITVSIECFDTSGACCLTDGTCISETSANCAAAGGTFQGMGASCSPNPCTPPDPTGACCLPDHTCSVETAADCATLSGTYNGDGMACTASLCTPTGACCLGDGSCSVETADDCGTAGGSYEGDDVGCGSVSCPLPCPADLDGSGDVGFGDILQAIGVWGSCPGCPEDLDGSGDVGFSDVLQIIGAWGACP